MLGRDVVVEEGATVRDSVVLDDAVVRSGASWRDAIVDVGADVDPGTVGDRDESGITIYSPAAAPR